MTIRKTLLLLFGALVALPALSQVKPPLPGYWIGEVTRIWYPKQVVASDGYTYRYLTYAGADTAIVHITGLDTFEVQVVLKKYNKYVPPLPEIISTVDDNTVVIGLQDYNPPVNAGDNIFIPATGWSHMKDQTWNVNHYNKTASIVDLVGGYVELTCTCYKVEWYSEKRENHGIASIQIDNGVAIDVDLYEKRTDNNSSLVFTTPNMSNATHKLRVNYTARKNPAAIQFNILHDKFVVYKKQ